MRLAIVHDSFGNVLGLAASPPDAPVAYPQVKAGQQVTLVDAPEMAALRGQELVDRLKDIVANHRLDLRPSTSALIRK